MRTRNALYALAVLPLTLALVAAGPKPKGHDAVQEANWPAPVVAGGAMPVTWSGIQSPAPTDWFGLFPPEAPDNGALEWSYVSCSQTPVVGLRTGTCGFVVPSNVPPGSYEIRLFSADGRAVSHRFDVLDGGWR